MDACFGEKFTSAFVLPGLPFEGAVRLRNITTINSKAEESPERVGTSVDPEESYPKDIGLPLPSYEQAIADITHLSESKRGPKTRKQHSSDIELSQERNKIQSYFVSMKNDHTTNGPEHLMNIHEMNDEIKKNISEQEKP